MSEKKYREYVRLLVDSGSVRFRHARGQPGRMNWMAFLVGFDGLPVSQSDGQTPRQAFIRLIAYLENTKKKKRKPTMF